MTQEMQLLGSVPFRGQRVFTEEWAAAILEVTEETLRKWRSPGWAGGPRFIQYGQTVLYAADVLAKWIERNGGKP